MPASLAGVVTGVVGLDQSAQLVHTDIVRDRTRRRRPASATRRRAPRYWAETDLALRHPACRRRRQPLPYAPCGLHARPARGRLRHRGASDGAGPDRGHHRRLRVADHRRRTSTQWSAEPRPAAHDAGSSRQVVAPGTYRRPRTTKQDPQGWYGEETLDVEAVHGDGAGRQDRLRRRAEQLPGPRRGAEPRRRSAPGADRHELLRLRDRVAAAGLHQAVQPHAHPGRRRGHRRVLLLGRRRRRDLEHRLSHAPTGRPRARG